MFMLVDGTVVSNLLWHNHFGRSYCSVDHLNLHYQMAVIWYTCVNSLISVIQATGESRKFYVCSRVHHQSGITIEKQNECCVLWPFLCMYVCRWRMFNGLAC
jgi:hypothetical protein